jgi:hypothetical protein
MVFIHSVKLAFINLAGIFAGFAVYHLTGLQNQIAVQVPVAVLFTVIGFVTWLWMTRRTRVSWTRAGARQHVLVFALALVWSAVVFVPLHYFTQGYVTAWSNITAMWAFQMPANLIALFLAHRVFASPVLQEGNG